MKKQVLKPALANGQGETKPYFSAPDIPRFPASLADSKSASPPKALYQKIKEYILEQIRSGQWPPESRVPSENQIVETLGVSRMTANRALRELTSEGHLERVQGVGTFVAQRKPQGALLEIKNIADEISAWGGNYQSRVHLLTEETVPLVIAREMGIEPGSLVFHSIIVHCDGNRPLQLSDRYVNPQVAPDYLQQDFSKITPNQYLMSVAPISEVEHVIEAILPDEQAQKLLEVGKYEPCIIIHRRTWSMEMVATKSRFIYPGSRYRLGATFRPQAG